MLKLRLEAAITSLHSLKPPPAQAPVPRPKRLSHCPSAGLLLAQVEGVLAGQRQRERGQVETEYQRKAQLFDLNHPSLRPLPKAPSSQRPSLTPSEGHMSRYPTATSLLSPKSAFALDPALKDLEKDLLLAHTRSQAQEATITALKLTQETFESRLFALESRGKEENVRESTTKEAGKDRKYIQELYILRKRKEQDKARRWLEREKGWTLDLEAKIR